MSNLSAAALKDELINFSAATIESNVLQSFQYEGFSATYIYGLLRTRENDFATFNREMSLLCLVGMMRGTRLDKITASMSAAGAALLTQLINKYTIINTVSAAARKSSVTIGRIMSVFPHVCLSFSAAGHVRDFGLRAEYTLPSACRFPQFAALIPSTQEYGWLWDSFVEWAIDMDDVINGDRANPKNVERFATITNMNSLFNDTQRMTILATHGLSFDLEDEVLDTTAAQAHAHDLAVLQQGLAHHQQQQQSQQQQQQQPQQQQQNTNQGNHGAQQSAPAVGQGFTLMPPPLAEGRPLPARTGGQTHANTTFPPASHSRQQSASAGQSQGRSHQGQGQGQGQQQSTRRR